MAARSVTVRVPASSANLGPGFDCFALALALHLEVTVSEAERFEVSSDVDVPLGPSNLVVRAFERLASAERMRFEIRSQIPLSGGLGSSAAAIVAGLLAADTLSGAHADLLATGSELEGHPDNVAAALYGGVVLCADGAAVRIEAPAGISAVLVVPVEGVPTALARAALPSTVPLADAVHNTAHGALLMLGIARGEHDLIARGLHDRLHQSYRASLFPRSAALLGEAASLGAIGASISGAGPTVLLWVADENLALVSETARTLVADWATVLTVPFADSGAAVIAA
jgi:homoserine kinase